MLTYSTLQDRPREFLAATGLTHDEFARLLPAFAAAYAVRYPSDKTWQGKVRQRQSGGGAKGVLPHMEDKLFFILVYQKTNPLQTMHGLQFELSQPQSHYWIHRLLPVLQRALAALGVAPARIAGVYARFGAALADNPGRMMRFDTGGVRVLLDYAHNPDGLRGFLQVASTMRTPQGRLGLVLGHAGNRTDEEVRALARVAADFQPELIVIKEDEAHLRGRSAGDVPLIIRTELLRLGLPAAALPMRASELDADALQLSGLRILPIEEGRKQRDPDVAGAHDVSNPRISGIMLHCGVPRGGDRNDSPMAPQFLQPTRAPQSSLLVVAARHVGGASASPMDVFIFLVRRTGRM